MYCTERQRLFDTYYESVSAFASTLSSIDRFWSFPPTERKKSLQVAIVAESARLALEEHEREHGCSCPLLLPRSPDSETSSTLTG
jgi:hypothetical protein